MQSMTAYENLEKHFRRLGDLQHVGAIVSWDEAAMMPVGGGESRGDAMATLSVVVHEMLTDPCVGEWLDESDGLNDLSAWQTANLREIRRSFDAATVVTADLVRAKSLATARCEQAWRVARAANDWATMAPLLETVIGLTREEAAMRAAANGLDPYDALLDTYEPGMRAARVAGVFGELKGFLPEMVGEIIDAQKSLPATPITGEFSEESQRQLGLAMMKTLGFDFDRGRLDVSHHPFCGGVPDDVRITTRYRTDSFAESLMAVLHETGHAMYEQGLPVEWRGQPVGEALSMATHESQSLLMEMQACRTREFMQHMTPSAHAIFLGGASTDPVWSSENLYRLCTRVERGFIRVDADEVTYPLHVILRFEIERALIGGSLTVDHLPEAWDEKMQAYLGLDTQGNYADGCLQDVHWQAGLIGYFPTYSLGAMTAAQLFAAVRRALPDVMSNIAEGDFTALLAWLRANIHSQGRRLNFDELLTAATGQPLTVAPFRAHLQSRYLASD